MHRNMHINEHSQKGVLVCGDRNWKDQQRLIDVLDRIHMKEAINFLVHGACWGADLMAQEWARHNEVPYVGIPARWLTGELGRGEGPARNQRMLDLIKPSMVVAFHDDLESSRGTLDMITRARKAGVPTYHFTVTGGRKL